MWQAPNQRAKTDSRKHQRYSRQIHLRRVQAEIRFPAEKSAAASVRVFLNDLSAGGVGIYTSCPIDAGKEIELIIETPAAITVHGKTVWCQEFVTTSHVLSSVRYTHRVGIEFIFANPSEAEKIKTYCEQFAATPSPAQR